MKDVPRVDGSPYQDVAVLYGDMSRLVVAWLASLTPAQISEQYIALGWGGVPNGRALHEAARHWMNKHRNDPAEPSAAGD